MNPECFFRVQLTLKTTLCHGPNDPCNICRYGHIMADVASEFLSRAEFDDQSIIRWADEVDRCYRKLPTLN